MKSARGGGGGPMFTQMCGDAALGSDTIANDAAIIDARKVRFNISISYQSSSADDEVLTPRALTGEGLQQLLTNVTWRGSPRRIPITVAPRCQRRIFTQQILY